MAEVLILCGGLGTRLREETEFRPKPMVYVGNRPILWHIMKIYAYYGHTDFILALGYKGEMIKDYFCHYEMLTSDVSLELGRPDKLHIHRNKEEAGWRITLADTGEKTLKGARIKRAEKYVKGDTFMVTYGDGLADIDLRALLDFHLGHGKLGTVTGVNPASRFGELKTDGNRVQCFAEKARTPDHLVSGGFFVFNRRFFNYLSPEDGCDLEVGPLEKLASEGQLMVYKHSKFWACMDTIRDMEYLNRLWDENMAEWKVWK